MTRTLGVRHVSCQLRLTYDEAHALGAYAASARLSVPHAVRALIRAAEVSDCDWQSQVGYDRPRYLAKGEQKQVSVSIPEADYELLQRIAHTRDWTQTSVVRYQLRCSPTEARVSAAPMTDRAFFEIINRLAIASVANNGRTDLANEKLMRSYVSGAFAARQLLTATKEANK